LKTPYRDGTTGYRRVNVFFYPTDFIGKLATLIPPPIFNLSRFYGVFAPNSKLRAQVTASQRGKNSPKLANKEHNPSDNPYQAGSMGWAQRLKRVFNIDITECEKCQRTNVTVIACITAYLVILRILRHLAKKCITRRYGH
jgi:hypothetical protein